MSGRRRTLPRVPVWLWRVLMSQLGPHERRRFNRRPIESVDYTYDIDYLGDGIPSHLLDVVAPRSRGDGGLPVYVYFHGGGWTSGDKAALTKYCASQAEHGIVVVNVNYRPAGRFHMQHMLRDGDAALGWVRDNVAAFGGDPGAIVLGGDSAGGQIAALLAAMTTRQELGAHYGIDPSCRRSDLRGLALHCSAVDFSVMFDPGFVMGMGFVRMLLPGRGKGLPLRGASRWLSPIEWLDERFVPVFVTTSERDFFYGANLNFIRSLRSHGVHVDVLIYDFGSKNTEHTWQQDASYPESQEVYRRLRQFVRRVTGRSMAAG
ncbi:MAG TPA: alpha/beta hydrolase [Humibacter sp.]|nr:alpha/beta hydrolase [Humibacter sp.]